MAVGAQAPRPPRGSTGLYHLAWEVPQIEDLAAAAGVLSEAGALGGASDHGATKSLYGQDPVFNSVRDPAARELLISAFDLAATEPEWALAYRFDIVLRATPFEETP